MDLVDFIGLNNSSIILRAMNNACHLSHIQPSGTRQTIRLAGLDSMGV
jgi:hypothetical protein